jgi:hypothetical protein
MSDDDYKITDDDIEKVLYYLRLTKPDVATPEMAIKILKAMHAGAKESESFGDEAIEKILKDLEEH